MVELSMTTEDMARLYIESHLTMREIASRTGISHVAVYKRLHKAGVNIADGTKPAVTCAHCGGTFRRKRCDAKAWNNLFCSQAHYTAHIQSKSSYREWRQGQKIARGVVGRYFTLQRGHVVHHHDGDNTHNTPDNLAVFASQAEHMRQHRGGHAAPIWDGKFLGPMTPTSTGLGPSGGRAPGMASPTTGV